MTLADLLRPDLVVLPLEATDKWSAISALARAAVRAGALPERLFATVEAALLERERSLTTGMEHGIAIPHAAVEGIDDVIAVLGLTRDGIEFEAIDGQPASIIVCLVIPRAKKLLHIKTLASIARLLGRGEVRRLLLESNSGEQAIEILRAEDSSAQPGAR